MIQTSLSDLSSHRRLYKYLERTEKGTNERLIASVFFFFFWLYFTLLCFVCLTICITYIYLPRLSIDQSIFNGTNVANCQLQSITTHTNQTPNPPHNPKQRSTPIHHPNPNMSTPTPSNPRTTLHPRPNPPTPGNLPNQTERASQKSHPRLRNAPTNPPPQHDPHARAHLPPSHHPAATPAPAAPLPRAAVSWERGADAQAASGRELGSVPVHQRGGGKGLCCGICAGLACFECLECCC
ncbi:hypothetical protein EYC80_000265 [Monilinia laxa]|uniref:Cysteine-rich transmembrane CYSTM domain-containing protein n=1 Tax=Monilinia laxa TaxID=61186 RepID=A0A5N6KA15_MONLA|nr:hypothetical protein EYC80_000265 [Monilinia laxa]